MLGFAAEDLFFKDLKNESISICIRHNLLEGGFITKSSEKENL